MELKIPIKVMIVCILVINFAFAQKQAQFEMNFYFEDVLGRKDTLFFRADTSILDDPTTSVDDLNLDWGESIDNSPFDSTLSVRAKPLFVTQGNFYKNIILQAYDNGQGCIAPKPVVIFVYTSSWPIKMTWDQNYFRNQDCLYGTFATPDADYAKKWLFNDPVPIREIACLGNQNRFTKDLRERELFSNWELPYGIFHDVIGKGKVSITAIQVYFGSPWAHLCDTLTSVKDLDKLDISIFPTIVFDQLNIKNADSEILNYQIINIEGKVINTFISGSNDISINLEYLNSGIYFIMIQNNEGNRISKKIVKL